MNLPFAHYLVGGAVRDQLLGLAVSEHDWVVVGASEAEMLSAGFRPVGRDFPVFLHPDTQEEYALARTERKTGPGHDGFVCHSSPDVTLEEDLLRRDLTINAIAQLPDGQLVDPYGGQQDIDARVLRHVSAAFREDPLRVLRIARFLARFAHLGFSVAPETTTMCAEMVAGGDLQELSAERINTELTKALAARSPADFFAFLDRIEANRLLWPEINYQRLRDADTGTLTAAERFAVCLADAPAEDVKGRCEHLKTSREYRDLAVLSATHQHAFATPRESNGQKLVALLGRLDSRRRPERYRALLNIMAYLHKVDTQWWLQLAGALDSITTNDLPRGLKGADIARALAQRRITIADDCLAQLRA